MSLPSFDLALYCLCVPVKMVPTPHLHIAVFLLRILKILWSDPYSLPRWAGENDTINLIL